MLPLKEPHTQNSIRSARTQEKSIFLFTYLYLGIMGVTSCAQVFREPNREVPEVLINTYAFPKLYIELKEIKQHSLTQTKGDITGKLQPKSRYFIQHIDWLWIPSLLLPCTCVAEFDFKILIMWWPHRYFVLFHLQSTFPAKLSSNYSTKNSAKTHKKETGAHMVMGEIKSNKGALKFLLVSAEGRKEFVYIIMHLLIKNLRNC